MCQCVEGCFKSTEPKLKVFFRLFSTLHSCENSVGEGFVVATFRENMEPDQKFELKQNFWSKVLQRLREIWHLHIISWVRSTRDITGFLSEPSYAMILTKMAKFVRICFCLWKASSYLFCHRVNEPNINVLLLSNTWNENKMETLKTCFHRSRNSWEICFSEFHTQVSCQIVSSLNWELRQSLSSIMCDIYNEVVTIVLYNVAFVLTISSRLNWRRNSKQNAACSLLSEKLTPSAHLIGQLKAINQHSSYETEDNQPWINVSTDPKYNICFKLWLQRRGLLVAALGIMRQPALYLIHPSQAQPHANLIENLYHDNYQLYFTLPVFILNYLTPLLILLSFFTSHC